MSLLDEYKKEFVILDRTSQSDGRGSIIYTYVEGAPFTATIVHHRIHTLLVEGVLHGEAIHYGAEHAHGVALGAVHTASRSRNAANEVAAANHESNLHALLDDGSNFRRHVRKDDVVDAVALFACEGFATELEKNTLEFRHDE